MQDGTRRCGNCGERVGETDVTCPHCGALLAAYEPAPGSTAPLAPDATPVPPITESAPPPAPVTPDAPETPAPAAAHPYESVTGRSLSELEDDRLEVGTTSSSLGPGSESPITQALRETRAAADLDEPGEDDTPDDHDEPPLPSERPIDLAEAREALGLSPEPEAEPLEPEDEPPVQEIATLQPQRERPSPRERAARQERPLTQHTRQAATPPTVRKPPGVSIQALFGAVIVIIVVGQMIGAGAFMGIIFFGIILIPAFWSIQTMIQKTGRK